MKTTFATIDEIIHGRECPFPISVIPNNLGINLCAVDAISWTALDDGQLVILNSHFKPEEPRYYSAAERPDDEKLQSNNGVVGK